MAYKIWEGYDPRDMKAKVESLTLATIEDIGEVTPVGKMYMITNEAASTTQYKLIIAYTPEELKEKLTNTTGYYVQAIGTLGSLGKMYALLKPGTQGSYKLFMSANKDRLAEDISNASGYYIVDSDTVGMSGMMYVLMRNQTALQAVSKTTTELAALTAGDTITPASGYDGISKVTVTAPASE